MLLEAPDLSESGQAGITTVVGEDLIPLMGSQLTKSLARAALSLIITRDRPMTGLSLEYTVFRLRALTLMKGRS